MGGGKGGRIMNIWWAELGSSVVRVYDLQPSDCKLDSWLRQTFCQAIFCLSYESCKKNKVVSVLVAKKRRQMHDSINVT